MEEAGMPKISERPLRSGFRVCPSWAFLPTQGPFSTWLGTLLRPSSCLEVGARPPRVLKVPCKSTVILSSKAQEPGQWEPGPGRLEVFHQHALLRPGTPHNRLLTWVAQSQVTPDGSTRDHPTLALPAWAAICCTFGHHSGFFSLVEAGSQDGHSLKRPQNRTWCVIWDPLEIKLLILFKSAEIKGNLSPESIPCF